MKKRLLPIFIFLNYFSFGQKNLPVGVGIIKIDFTKLPTLSFFADTSQVNPIKTISIVKNKADEFIIKNEKQDATWFMPEQLSLGYDIFIMRVDTIIGKWYKVVVNNQKGIALWTKVEPVKKFIKWSTFLLEETTAIEKGFADIEIKTLPSENAKTIKKIETKDCFEVLEIKEDWMKIRTNTKLDCNESSRPIKSGWLKWRHKNRLTISYSLTC